MGGISKRTVPVMLALLIFAALGCGGQGGSSSDGSQSWDGGSDGGFNHLQCYTVWDKIYSEIEQTASTLRSCDDDKDCIVVWRDTECEHCCATVIGIAGVDAFKTALSEVSKEYCTAEFIQNCGIRYPSCSMIAAKCSGNKCIATDGGYTDLDAGINTDAGLPCDAGQFYHDDKLCGLVPPDAGILPCEQKGDLTCYDFCAGSSGCKDSSRPYCSSLGLFSGGDALCNKSVKVCRAKADDDCSY